MSCWVSVRSRSMPARTLSGPRRRRAHFPPSGPAAAAVIARPRGAHAPSRILLGDEADDLDEVLVGQQRLDRGELALELLVGEHGVDGAMAVRADRLRHLPFAGSGDEVMIAGV